VGEKENGEVDNFVDAASSLEAILACFWVRLPRASTVAARREMSVEDRVLGRVAN